MVIYIELGNIFKIDGVANFAHGCNCAGAMGKGIALQFKEMFPEMYMRYKNLCAMGTFKLGEVFEYNYGKGYVFNLGTQATWRTKADIKAIEVSMRKMLHFAFNHQIKSIAMPKIGAGLGGLMWESVKEVIEEVAKEYPYIDLYVIENFKENG